MRLHSPAITGSLTLSGSLGGSANSTASFGVIHIPDSNKYKLGLGTTAPAASLHIAQGASGQTEYIRLENNGSDEDYSIHLQYSVAGNMIIKNNNHIHQVFDANGKVGIGIGAVTPGVALEVGGSVSGSATSTGSFGSLALGTGGISLKDGQSLFGTGGIETGYKLKDDAELSLNAKGSISVNIDTNNNETTHGFRVLHGAVDAGGTKIFEVTETSEISGSSTSTGSFAIGRIADRLGVGIHPAASSNIHIAFFLYIGINADF